MTADADDLYINLPEGCELSLCPICKKGNKKTCLLVSLPSYCSWNMSHVNAGQRPLPVHHVPAAEPRAAASAGTRCADAHLSPATILSSHS